MPTSVSTGLSPKSFVGGCFLAGFGLVWSGFVLTFDAFEFSGLYHQLVALRYATAPGRVISSDVKVIRSKRKSERDVYSPNIRFSYEVGGATYHGDRYCYGQMASNDNSAARTIAEFPPGAAVTVYYRHSDPSDSLLRPGVMGTDLFVLLFMLPFNLVMFGIWWTFAYQLLLRRLKQTAGGAKVVDDGFQVRVRLAVFTPMAAALVTMAALSLVTIFALAFTVGTNPALGIMVAVWGGLLAAGIIAGAARAVRLASGEWDLAIDNMERTVRLPRGMGRKTPVTVPIANITGFGVETVSKHGAEGETTYRYAPAVFYSTPDGHKFKVLLVEWYDENRARDLASWIGERLQELGWQQK
jgi:hypothetical protein